MARLICMVANRRRFLKITSVSLIQTLFLPCHRFALAWSAERNQSAISYALAKFRQQFEGDIVLPSDPSYDVARRVESFNPTTDRRPQLVVRCANHDDVVRAVRFAREHELEASIRAGGFDVLGASTCEGGIVIELSRMKQVNVDLQRRTATVQAGVRAGELSAAAEPYGLAAALGCHPGIGVTGLTLGGGLGWLAGKHGAACDNLVDAKLVTADGNTLHVSADENPDLFWAVKGGGGNFGVVTSMTLRLHPVTQVFGGVAAYRGDIAAFLRFYRDFMKQAPDGLTVELSIRVLGKPTVLATACWSGDPTDGKRVLRPLREFGPLADAMGIVPYSHLIDRPGPEFGRRLFSETAAPPPSAKRRCFDYWRGGSWEQLSDAGADAMANTVLNAPFGWSIGIGHYIHGEVSRAGEAESPLPRRTGQATYFFDMGWYEPSNAEAAMAWVDKCHADMKSHSSAGTYINYLSSDSPSAVRASYASSYARLASLKRKYDPYNFYHLNRNIRPT